MTMLHTADEIVEWIQQYIANLLQFEAQDVDTGVEFASYGLTSSSAVALIADLEDALRCELSPALLFEYPTIDAVAKHLESQVQFEIQQT